jgi:hypothetical protein
MSQLTPPEDKTPAIERRFINVKDLRFVDGDGAAEKIEGHAAVFNEWSEVIDLGWFAFREQIKPGAFSQAIQKDDIRALMNHDPNYVLGRNISNTLQLAEDEIGLKSTVFPPDTQWARDLKVSMKRGDVSQMSFGFISLDEEWGRYDGMDSRTILRAKLFDVSIVTFPAYPQTDASVRSMARKHLEDIGKKRKQEDQYKQRLYFVKKISIGG